jgi:hypothetical protein
MKTSIRTPLFIECKKIGLYGFISSLFSQTGFAQTRVVVNPGLEFGMPNGTVNQLDANFGFGATFDAGAPVTSMVYITPYTGRCLFCRWFRRLSPY